MVTRRSLLRVGALAPLIIPGRSLARVGGAAGAAAPGPCGSPIPVATINEINTRGPGCYQLTQDDPAGFVTLQTYDNVTLLGNGHKLLGTLQVGRSDGTNTGLAVEGLACYQIQAYGTPGTTQTASPVVHLNGITVSRLPTNAALPATIHGSNVLVENCTFDGTAGTGGTDDTLVLYNFDDPGPPAAHPTSAWCTFSNCHFGPNFDVGFEGVGNWDHVTITNCISNQGSFGGMGAWYRYVGDPNCGFIITNCTFTSNTLTSWRFCTPQNPSDAAIGSFVDTATSDAAANSKWGTGTAFGNVFGGSGPLANTYVALTREQCEARAAMYAANRRNPPPEWPPDVWNEIITCP